MVRNGAKRMTDYSTFHRGQIVRSIYGERLTVLYQIGCQVFVAEYCNAWFHPSKLFCERAAS